MARELTNPAAAIVHLSGPRRGTTEFLSEDRVVIAIAPGGGVQLTPAEDAPHRSLAVLERRGQTFELTANPGAEVWINGEKLDQFVLASGDVVEASGTVMRFRLYPPERGRYKTMAEAFSDCVDCARYGAASPVERAGIFVSQVPTEIMRQTAPRVRVALVAMAIAAVGLSGTALVRSVRVEHELQAESARVEGLARMLDRSDSQVLTAADLVSIRSEIEVLKNTETRVEELEDRAGARGRVIATASRSVIFLQGAYGFTEPDSGRPLRFAVAANGRPMIGPNGQPALTIDGEGPEVEIFYTGTGFIATGEGEVVTNRHVAEPWLFDEDAEAIIGRGLVPGMRRFIGYLPGETEPFDVSLVASSETADVALLRCQVVTTGLPALPLDDRPLAVGDEVIVLGYPAGIRAMIARSQRAVLPELEARGEVDFWEVAQILADGDHIAPLATQGIVGQITADSVVYDANTTHGGSGGPVLGADGRVVAINSAVIPDFAGSNLGVPAAEALRLLRVADEGP